MPMPPSPYTSIEVLLAIFESYMHNCTTTSIEALLPMSKYYIYKQAIPSSKCGVASKPMIWSFNRATKWRWKQVMDLSVSQRLRQPWVRLWDSAIVLGKWVRLSPSLSSVIAIVILAVIMIVDIFLICQSHSNHVSNQETWWWEPPSAGQVLLFLFFRSLKRSSFELGQK